MASVSRRRFVWGMGAAGLCAAAVFGRGNLDGRKTEDGLSEAGSWEAAGPAGPGDWPGVFRKTSWALGAAVSLTVRHEDESAARAACDAALGELELVERLMSLYRADSQVSQLNRQGTLRDPHPYLVQVLRAAERTSERSRGAFDITVQPLWELYAAAFQAHRLPSPVELAEARRHVDWRRVEIDAERIQLRGQGTRITLNGIAQGFAADRVRASLLQHGVKDALIDTGEISALGGRSPRDGWRVGIQHPRDSEAYLGLARLSGKCLATSGDYATTFSRDHRHHHLFDPRGGPSPGELCSVSVAADTGLEADALSTALFVLGLEAGCELVGQSPGVSALLVTRSGRTAVTPGFPLA